MPVGISKCKNCKKEFKWKRNRNQNLPSWCSSKCRGHKDYEKRIIYKCTCHVCKKEFISKKTSKFWIGKYCSTSCRIKGKSWLENRELWKNLTKCEKINKMKKNLYLHTIKNEGCWDWNGAIHHSGYTQMKIGKQIGGHVVSYMVHHGKIEKGLSVCHKCDNKRCTNPDHLFLGTYKENSQDMVKKKRHCYGEKNYFAKLLNKEVIEIKKLLTREISIAEIARIYNVSHACIYSIKSKKTWNLIE